MARKDLLPHLPISRDSEAVADEVFLSLILVSSMTSSVTPSCRRPTVLFDCPSQVADQPARALPACSGCRLLNVLRFGSHSFRNCRHASSPSLALALCRVPTATLSSPTCSTTRC